MAEKSHFSDILKKAQHAHIASSKPSVKVKSENSLRNTWSDEQESFFACKSPSMFLKALAGTGKTSSLLEFARRRPHENWTFLAFNRSVAEEVLLKAPRNLKVQTVHQLAFSKFGHPLAHKMKDNIEYGDFAEYFPNTTPAVLLKVKKMFDHYLSSDKNIEEICCFVNFLNEHEPSEKELSLMKDMWKLSLLSSSSFPISHDVYLKRFNQSEHEWLSPVMLDEAQDWTDGFLNAFVRAPTHILCGDPYQNIYLWRRATEKIETYNQHVFWLTQSFRQSKEFEPLVNYFLKKMNCPKKWKGLSSPGSIDSTEQVEKNMEAWCPTVALAYDHQTLNDLSLPDAQKITIHASKGLEFDRVWVCDNPFPAFLSFEEKTILSYVAVTRAKKSLRVPQAWKDFSHLNEKNTMEENFEDSCGGFFDGKI